MRVRSVKRFRQADTRWGELGYRYAPYFMQNAGCGPTSCASIIASNPKYKNITPKETRDFMIRNGYCVNGHGTDWDGIPACLRAYGFIVKEVDMTELFKLLARGKVRADLLMRKGTRGGVTWTSNGHFISISGFKRVNGQEYLYVNDSGGRHHDGWFNYKKTMYGLVRKAWSAYLPSTKLKSITVKKKSTKKTLNGVDVSANQPSNILSKISYDFAIVKLSGNPNTSGYKWNYVNSYAKKQVNDAYKKTGLVGLYHFTYGLADPTKEADFFVTKVKELGYLGKAMLVIDYEGEGALNRGNTWVKKLCDRVKSKAGYAPILYASSSVIRQQGLGSIGYKLWCANYYKGYTTIKGYDTSGCEIGYKDSLIWQYTSTGVLKRYNGKLDLDVFFGSEEDFKKYIKVSAKKESTEKKTKKKTRVYPELPARGYFITGDKGVNVKRLQTLLNKAGYICGNVDGVYGNSTAAAVRMLQKKHKITVDGCCGKKTIEALKKALK